MNARRRLRQARVSVGASYLIDDWIVSAHFSNAFFVKRTTLSSHFPGTYAGQFPGGTMAYLFGLTVTGTFDFSAPMGGTPRPPPPRCSGHPLPTPW